MLVEDGDHVFEPVFDYVLRSDLCPTAEHFAPKYLFCSCTGCLERKKARSTANIENVGLPTVLLNEITNALWGQIEQQLKKPDIALLYASFRLLSFSIEDI